MFSAFRLIFWLFALIALSVISKWEAVFCDRLTTSMSIRSARCLISEKPLSASSRFFSTLLVIWSARTSMLAISEPKAPSRLANMKIPDGSSSMPAARSSSPCSVRIVSWACKSTVFFCTFVLVSSRSSAVFSSFSSVSAASSAMSCCAWLRLARLPAALNGLFARSMVTRSGVSRTSG